MQPECGVQQSKESPIERAMNRQKEAIGSVQETMTRFETKLSSVITHPEKSTKEPTPEPAAQTSLETRLNEMTEDILGVNTYLLEVQNRVQL